MITKCSKHLETTKKDKKKNTKVHKFPETCLVFFLDISIIARTEAFNAQYCSIRATVGANERLAYLRPGDKKINRSGLALNYLHVTMHA